MRVVQAVRDLARWREGGPWAGGLARGAVYAFLIRCGGLGLAYGLQVLLARWLAPSEYGVYAYVLTWAALLAVPVQAGVPGVVLRFLPAYEARGQAAYLKGLLQAGGGVTLGLGLGFAAVATLALYVASLYGEAMHRGAFLAGAWLVPGLVWMNYQMELFRAAGQVGPAYLPRYVLQPLLIAGGAGLLLAYRGTLTGTAVLCVYAAVTLLLVLARAWPQHRLARVRAGRAAPRYAWRTWRQMAWPTLLISGCLALMNQADVVMLGFWQPEATVGVYYAAAKTASLVSFILIAVNAVAVPAFSDLFAREEHGRLQQLLHRLAHGIFWPTALLVLVLALGGRFILGLFGPSFTAALPLLLVLMAGHLVNAGAGAVGYLLMMSGHQHVNARVYGWSALLHLGLNALAIPRFGAMGAALATAATMVVWNVWLYRCVVRLLGLRPSVWAAVRGRRPVRYRS